MEQLIGRSIGHGRAISSPFPLQRTSFYGVLYRRMRRTYRRQSDHGERKKTNHTGEVARQRRIWKPDKTQASGHQLRNAQFYSQNDFIQKYYIALIEQNALSFSFTAIRCDQL